MYNKPKISSHKTLREARKSLRYIYKRPIEKRQWKRYSIEKRPIKDLWGNKYHIVAIRK